jgi:hypothetical protein
LYSFDRERYYYYPRTVPISSQARLEDCPEDMIFIIAIGIDALHVSLRLKLCFVAVERPEHKSRKRLEEWLEDGTHHFLGIEAVPLGLQARDNIRGQFF